MAGRMGGVQRGMPAMLLALLSQAALAGPASELTREATPKRPAATTVAAAASEVAPARTPAPLDAYPALRHTMMETISMARQRLWLATDFISDGDVVTGLYLAQYRKLEVRVLLGRAKANSPLSRLSYLKNQKIPVNLMPAGFKSPAPTALLADDTLYFADSDLDSYAPVRKVRVSRASPDETKKFLAQFEGAASLGIAAEARPLPLVGKPSPRGKVYGSEGESPYNTPQGGDTYRYGRKPHPRPPGVPDKLPRNLKAKERSDEFEPMAPALPEATHEGTIQGDSGQPGSRI